MRWGLLYVAAAGASRRPAPPAWPPLPRSERSLAARQAAPPAPAAEGSLAAGLAAPQTAGAAARSRADHEERAGDM